MEDIVTAYDRCKTASDFEQFIIRYNSDFPDHPLVVQAKRRVAQAAREKSAQFNPFLLLLAGFVCIGLGILLFRYGMSKDGAPASTVYHGEHVDVKVSNFDALFGIVGLLGGIALCGLGAYFIYGAVRCLVSKK